MNEQRLQTHLQLIESLLNCPNGEEIQKILVANQELLDAEFVQVVTAVAEKREQEGEENTTECLRNLAVYLTPENNTVTEADTSLKVRNEERDYFFLVKKTIKPFLNYR